MESKSRGPSNVARWWLSLLAMGAITVGALAFSKANIYLMNVDIQDGFADILYGGKSLDAGRREALLNTIRIGSEWSANVLAVSALLNLGLCYLLLLRLCGPSKRPAADNPKLGT